MFKFFVVCLFAILACAAAKPAVVAAPFAYSAYSAPLVAASPYTAAYTAPYSAAYTAPYTAAYASPYTAAYSAYPYASAYSAYPYTLFR